MMPRRDSLASRLLSVALSLSMVGGMVPAQAWAEAADEAAAAQAEAAAAALEETSVEVDAAEADSADAPGEDGPEAKDESETKGEGEDEAQAKPEGETASDPEPKDESEETGSSAPEDDKAEADEGDAVDKTETPDETDDAAPAKVAPAPFKAPADDAPQLSSDTSVKLQASVDAGYYASLDSISVGDTLWANAFNESGYSYTAVSSPTWTYQWMSSDSNSDSASDYTAIAGATSRSYTVGEDQASKYLICKVTDGSVTRYAPSGYWGDISTYATHGPVMGKGQVSLYKVELDKASPSVGDTIAATPYTSYSTKAPDNATVTYQWSTSSSKYGSFTDIEGATSSTLEVTDAYQGRYLRVTATSGNTVTATTSDAALGQGQVKLAGVKLDTPTGAINQGATLVARAYTGSSYSPTYVTDGVTYTWRYSESDPSGYGTISWTTIPDVTGSTLTLDKDEYLGKYISVQASAGANEVGLSDYSCPGPVRAQGQVDIYTAFVSTSQDSASATYLYTADDTLWAWAKEKGASDTIVPDRLTYQWQWSDSRNNGYKDIEGATGQSLVLAPYAGKYVRCHVASKVGSSSYDTRARNKVAASNAISISSVSLATSGTALSTGDKVEPGETLTAQATDADGADVTSNDKVTWQWYQAESSFDAGTMVEGATTSTYEPTESQAGSYVYAVANGGAQDASSPRVQVKKAGAVALDRVEVSGTAKVGETLVATSYVDSVTKADNKATVLYVWQASDKKSTSDYDFASIEGVTGSTLTLTDDLVGKYIRVVATSDNTVKSTSKPYYGTTTFVDPVGPVTLPGGYLLSGVEVTSSVPNVQVGATLTPKAQVSVTTSWGSYDTDAPDDAKLAYTWYAADADGTNEVALGGADGVSSDGSLVVPASLEGKRVWVSASALMNTVTSDKESVAARGTYSLKGVLVSPDTSTQLKTADTVSVRVYAHNLVGTGTEVTGKEGVSLQWYVADSMDASDDQWEALDGATSTTLMVPASADGLYLKVVATSAGSTASATFDKPVAKANTPRGAAAVLSGADISGWRPQPVYANAATHNINDLLLAELASQGVDTEGMTVTVQVSFEKADAAATVGVGANGEVTFFSCDPDRLTPGSTFLGTYMNALRSGDVTYTISKEGEQDATYSTRLVVPWDEAAAQTLLQVKADQLTIGYSEGDSANSVTKDVSLPYKAGKPSSSWTSVTWTSSDTALVVSGDGISDYVGKVSRSKTDQAVQVKATVAGLANYGLPEGVGAAETFSLTVKADPQKVAAEKARLQAMLENGFAYANVTDFGTGAAIAADGTGITGDLQLPNTRKYLDADGSRLDGKYYSVTYSVPTGTTAVSVDAYHASVVRPLGQDVVVPITCTIASKANPEISVSKTLDFTIKAVAAGEIDAEVALMDEAEEGYKAALLNGQTEPVAENLTTFQELYAGEDGSLAVARSASQADKVHGIVTCELDGYDSMGSADQARTFRPSDTSILENEDLKLAWNVDANDYLGRHHDQPQFNTAVTVTSKLASERYGGYYALYKDDPTVDPDLLAKLLRLAPHEVSATINVAGTTGQEAPIPQVSVAVSVIGVDAFGSPETWASGTYTVDEGTSATVASKRLFDESGLSVNGYDSAYGYYLDSIVSPDTGKALGYDAATGRYWQLFVNGQASETGADGVQLKDGDSVAWCYSAYGDALPTPDQRVVTAKIRVVGPDGSGTDANWVALTERQVVEGTTAAQLTEQVLGKAGLAHESSDTGYGYYLSTITSPYTGARLGWDEKTGKFWQLFVNGESSQVMADQVVLKAGDVVSWQYSTWDSGAITPTDVKVNPDARRPKDYTSEWPGFKGNDGGTTTAPTPTTGATASWTQSLKEGASTGMDFVSMSDPIIVEGNVYLAVSDQLQIRDAKTGAVKATAPLAAPIGYFSRIQYADGLVLVPLEGGRLQAITATSEKPETVWVTPALTDGEPQHGYSSILIRNGHAYLGTTTTYEGQGGWLLSVDLKDGAVTRTKSSSGYYWGGPASARDKVLVAEESGRLTLHDPRTLEEVSHLELGGEVRSGVTTSGDGTIAYVVTDDGTLHRIAVGADGTLAETGSVRFASYSTSTPTLVEDKTGARTIYVGGGTKKAGGTGGIYVIDANAMTLTSSATTLPSGDSIPGDVKSAPLLSTQSGTTYVYFTSNGNTTSHPGGVYCYQPGSATATLIFLPGAAARNYSTTSVVAGADGALYYTNDSSTLFRLAPGTTPSQVLPKEPTDSGGKGSGTGSNKGDGKATGQGDGQGDGGAGGGSDTTSTNPTGGLRSTLTTASGTTTRPASQAEGTPLGLLAGMASDEVGAAHATGVLETGSVEDGVIDLHRHLPIWPIVGMALGLVALVLALVARRKKKDDEEGEA